MNCLVSYDIEDNKVRTKLAKYLSGQGVRLQKSVFVVDVEGYRFSKFTRDIEKITGPGGDVALVRLCSGCSVKAVRLARIRSPFFII